MALSAPITAIFENGLLKPLEPLALKDHQRVRIFVVEDEAFVPPDPNRVYVMHEAAGEWLAMQSADAVQEPALLSPGEKEQLDAELDQLLAEIRRYSATDSDEEIALLVDEAVSAVRRSQ
jgi:hypothetical protein